MMNNNDCKEIEKCATAKKKVLFDSLTVHFSLWVFIEQFLNHMLFPLLLPWMVYRYGWSCLIAQQFLSPKLWSKDTLFVLWNWIGPAIFDYVVILHYGPCSHVQISLVFPVLLYTMHRGMISLKYATLSPSELRRLLRGSNISSDKVDYKWPSARSIANVILYQSQSMILSGYINIKSSVINLEVVVAGARAGIPLREIYFEIPNPNNGNKEKLQMLRWQVFLSKALHIPLNDPNDPYAEDIMNRIFVRQKNGSYRVCIHSVCVAIVHATCQCGSSIGYKTIFLLSLLNAAIPGFMADPPQNQVDVLYFICISSMNFVYYLVMLTILYAAVKEMHRKSCFSDILQCMIRLHDYNLKANVRLGGGGTTTDDRMITSEIKTIQDLIRENTDMIRLSSGADEDLQDSLRTSLISSSGIGNQVRKTFSIEDSFEDVQEDPETQSQSDANGTMNDIDGYGSQFTFVELHSSLTSDGSVEVPGSSMADFHFPQIDFLQYSDNFTTWMQCRQILQDFGYRFNVRLSALIVVILIILLSQSLWLVVHLLSAGQTNPFSESSVLQVVLWITVYAFTLAYIIFVAHVTNLKNIAHRETVNAHMLNMKQSLRRTPDANSKARERLKAGIDAAYHVTHSIAIMNEVYPIRIFGVIANARTSALILYALAVFLYALFQYSLSGNIIVPT